MSGRDWTCFPPSLGGALPAGMKQIPRYGYLFGLVLERFSVTRDDEDEQGRGFVRSSCYRHVSDQLRDSLVSCAKGGIFFNFLASQQEGL